MRFTLKQFTFLPKVCRVSPASTGYLELPLTPTVEGILQNVSYGMSSWHIALLSADFPQNNKENVIFAFIREA